MSRLVLLVGVMVFCVSQAAAAAPAYSVTAITGKYGAAVALNARGEVATNNYEAYIPSRASLVGPNGSVDFGTLGGSDSTVYGINNKGEAVGVSQIAGGELRAFLYTGGHMREFTPSRGIGPPSLINDRGDIAGQGIDRPFLYSKGKLSLLATTNSRVNDINEAGVVVGTLNLPGREHPFMFSQGKLTDLGTLGGAFGIALAINDVNAIVGYASTPSEQTRAFLYDGGTMRDLGGTAAVSMAFGINNLGQIVGSADEHAFLYSMGKMTDLNDLLAPGANYILNGASAINDRQQILATGCFTGNDAPSGCFGALLSPISAVPEPAFWLMLLTGAILGAACRYQRAHAPRRAPCQSSRATGSRCLQAAGRHPRTPMAAFLAGSWIAARAFFRRLPACAAGRAPASLA